MERLISMDEIFSMAVQIEHNAGRFYRRAAELHDEAGDVLRRLAAMEDAHKEQFQMMRTGTASPAGDAGPLAPEGAMYLEAVASGYRLEGTPKETKQLNGSESVHDILRTGIELEKQAILFYLGIKDIVPDNETQQVLDAIINEEKSHLTSLAKELKKPSAG